nr:PREDICTED: EGF-like module-containing mucin-like hormone receptor-like 1 [Opisthocomus hoazin]
MGLMSPGRSPDGQIALSGLRMKALQDLRSNSTKATELLLQSTEALVLQATLRRPGSGPQSFNISIMEAVAEVVRDDCPQATLVLAGGEQNLTISCHDAPRDVPRVGCAQQVLRAGEELSCVSWEMVGTKGRWTPEGCFRVGGDPLYSVCACTHFSTFAILVATRPIKEPFALVVVSYVGISVSLVCLFLTIVTFLLCRSLWSVSGTLHLQLSICLFAADLLFLVATHRTGNKLACAITAGFLHYLFLACFTWMFLEGLYLFLTVRNLHVLNYTSASRFRKRYVYPMGYGTPAIVVVISAAVHPSGYTNEHYCWLSMEEGFIWSFLGPVCVVVLVNLLFFLATLWMLRDKLSALNADVTVLKNNRLMTFKALANICVLGCTWGLGLLQAQGDNIAVAFVFTIINSLQGAFIFLMHCVLNRQVMEQYRRWFRALRRRAHPPEMPTSEIHVTYVTIRPTSSIFLKKQPISSIFLWNDPFPAFFLQV